VKCKTKLPATSVFEVTKGSCDNEINGKLTLYRGRKTQSVPRSKHTPSRL